MRGSNRRGRVEKREGEREEEEEMRKEGRKGEWERQRRGKSSLSRRRGREIGGGG